MFRDPRKQWSGQDRNDSVYIMELGSAVSWGGENKEFRGWSFRSVLSQFVFVFLCFRWFPFFLFKKKNIYIYLYILWIRMPGAEWTETRGSLWHHTRDHLANLDRTLWWWRVLHVCVEVQMPSVQPFNPSR